MAIRSNKKSKAIILENICCEHLIELKLCLILNNYGSKGQNKIKKTIKFCKRINKPLDKGFHIINMLLYVYK